MMGTDMWAIVFGILLLGLNAFFVSVEFALISSRRDRLDNMIAAGNRVAPKVLHATENLSIMLAGAQLGITLASVLLGKVGEPAVAHMIEAPFTALGANPQLLHPIAFSLSLLIVTVLHIILGEMVPKNIALAGPETVATYLIRPHLLFVTITHPIMVVLNWTARVTLRAMNVEQKDELDSTVSPSELAGMIAESRSEGLIAPAEAVRLSNALRSSRRTLAEVLIPAEQVQSIEQRGSCLMVSDVERAVAHTGFSRFPVTDTQGTWIGYVHIKDTLNNLVLEADPSTDEGANPLDEGDVRPLIHVKLDENFDVAMRRMRQTSSHIAAVVDDNGSIVGIVTLEDIIEELVGTVRDWTHDD